MKEVYIDNLIAMFLVEYVVSLKKYGLNNNKERSKEAERRKGISHTEEEWKDFKTVRTGKEWNKTCKTGKS